MAGRCGPANTPRAGGQEPAGEFTVLGESRASTHKWSKRYKSGYKPPTPAGDRDAHTDAPGILMLKSLRLPLPPAQRNFSHNIFPILVKKPQSPAVNSTAESSGEVFLSAYFVVRRSGAARVRLPRTDKETNPRRLGQERGRNR